MEEIMLTYNELSAKDRKWLEVINYYDEDEETLSSFAMRNKLPPADLGSYRRKLQPLLEELRRKKAITKPKSYFLPEDLVIPLQSRATKTTSKLVQYRQRIAELEQENEELRNQLKSVPKPKKK